MVATSHLTARPRQIARTHRSLAPFPMMTPHPAPPGGAFFMAPGGLAATGTHAVRARPWHRCINGGQFDACIPS